MKTLPTLQGIRVDIDALLSIRHTCDPAQCASRESCCQCYDVGVSDADIERVIGLLPQAARYAPHLREEDGFMEFFEEGDSGVVLSEDEDSGLCCFAFSRGKKGTFCALHAAAKDLQLDPFVMKPQPCTLWPLALSEDRTPILCVQSDAFTFPCNQRRNRGVKSLHRGIREIIEPLFGASFLNSLDALIGTRTKSPSSG